MAAEQSAAPGPQPPPPAPQAPAPQPAAPARVFSLAHIPMPFCVQGSTLITVTRELSRCQAAAGGRPLAVLSDNRSLEVPEAECLYVDHTRYSKREGFNRPQTAVDALLGRAHLRRRYHGRLHIPAVEAVRTRGVDVVLLYEGHYSATSLPWWNELRPQTKIILYLHNPLSRTYGPSELRRMVDQCDAMIFCADHLRRSTVDRLGDVDIPLQTIHNGIAPSFLEPATGERRGAADDFELLFLGRTSAEKGVHLMLEALGIAQRSIGRPVRAAVIGSTNYGSGVGLTDYEQGLRRIASQQQVTVEFLPHVDRATARARMTRASAICIPSLWSEGLPLVALEAMATGTPIVALDSVGVAEACGEAALYAASREPADLATAIVSLASDHESTMARAAVGVTRARGFSWENTWLGMAQLVSGLR